MSLSEQGRGDSGTYLSLPPSYRSYIFRAWLRSWLVHSSALRASGGLRDHQTGKICLIWTVLALDWIIHSASGTVSGKW